MSHDHADPAGLTGRTLSGATVTRWHDSSDYGTALGEFADRFAAPFGPRTCVFVPGDARTDRTPPNAAAPRTVRDRARRVHRLDPERRALWDTGESAAVYAEVVDMYECRTARLGALVARLLPM